LQESSPEEITKIWGKVIENELARQEEEKSDNAKYLDKEHTPIYELVLHENSKTLIKILNTLEAIHNEKT